MIHLPVCWNKCPDKRWFLYRDEDRIGYKNSYENSWWTSFPYPPTLHRLMSKRRKVRSFCEQWKGMAWNNSWWSFQFYSNLRCRNQGRVANPSFVCQSTRTWKRNRYVYKPSPIPKPSTFSPLKYKTHIKQRIEIFEHSIIDSITAMSMHQILLLLSQSSTLWSEA